ncbi:MAG: oligosaccharide flippase family protein [Spirochaetaceae bacterium]|nr:oligosaccharide flippase family protein [Spirochaetaceae bacterium]
MLAVAHFLSPDDFGVAATALAFCALVYVMPLTAMGDVLVAHPGRLELLAPTAARLSWLMAALGTCLIAGSIPLAIRWYEAYPAAWLGGLLAVLALRPTVEAMSVVAHANLRLKFRFRAIAMIDGGLQFVATLLSVVLSGIGARAASLVVPQILNQAGRAIGYHRTAAVRSTRGFHRGIAYVLMRDYLRGGAAQYIHGLTLQVNLIILGYVAGAYQAGLYGFASMLAVQVNSMIATRLGEVMQPILGTLRGDKSRQARVFVQSQQMLGAVCIPLALLQAALAEPLFELLFDSKWRPAIGLFQILALREVVAFAAGPNMSCLKAQGRFGLLLIYQVMHIALTVPIYWFAAHQGGAVGVAIGSAIVWCVTTVVVTWLCTSVESRGDLSRVIRVFARPLSCTLPLFAAGYLVVGVLSPWDATGDIVAVAGLGPVLAILALLILRSVDPEFRSLLDGLLRSGRGRYAEWRQRVGGSSIGGAGER